MPHADQNDDTTPLRTIHASLHGRLNTSGVKAYISLNALDSDLRITFGMSDNDAIRTQLLCDLEAVGVYVENDDLTGAGGLGDEHGDKTHGASTGNKDGVAEADACSSAGMDADRERLEESGLIERDHRGQLIAEVCVVNDKVGQGAIDRWGGGKFDKRAEVVAALFAGVAGTARDTRLDGNAVALLEARDVVGHKAHDARALVAEDHGLLDNEVADAALSPVVYILQRRRGEKVADQRRYK